MTEKLRVLTVYQHLPHYRSEVFAELSRDVDLDWTFAADVESQDRSIPTIPPDRLPRFHRLNNHWCGGALWQSRLIGLLLRERFDAVVFLGDVAYLSTWISAVICRARRSKVAFWTIGWHRPEHGVRRQIRLRFYRLAHVLLLYGQTGRRIGVDLGFPAERMVVVGNSESPHAVCASQSDDPESWLPSPDRNVLTAVVRLNPSKGLDLLIRAAAILNTQGRNVIVLLVGAGPATDELNALAAELGVDLRTPGPVYSSETIVRIYACTTVTVVPLNAGLTCIQSLANGRPVVTTDDPHQWMPESESIKPGVTGGLYEDGSVSSLAETIDAWMVRVRAEPAAVAADCKQEVAQRWTAEAQASAITGAVTSLLLRPTERRLVWQDHVR